MVDAKAIHRNVFFFVHERERRRLSDISAEGHTRQQGTNVYLSMCVRMSGVHL